MLSLGYRYVYAIVMSIAGLALCLRVSENAALALNIYSAQSYNILSAHTNTALRIISAQSMALSIFSILRS